MRNIFARIRYNSPLILTFALLSLAVLGIDALTGGTSTRYFFSVYRFSLSDPLGYIRLLGHVLGHASFSHYFSNMSLLLVLGPLVEEKYGTKRLLLSFLLTALVSGLLHCAISPNTALLGASGIVFMLILLSAFANAESGTIPLTVVLVAILYFGTEIYDAATAEDHVSQLAHISGGLCGLGIGAAMQRRR